MSRDVDFGTQQVVLQALGLSIMAILSGNGVTRGACEVSCRITRRTSA
jgi:hypothetical protein